MEQVKIFVLQFLDKEAECWTKKELANVGEYNQSVKELYEMSIDDLDEAFGLTFRENLREEEEPEDYSSGHLFKLSKYESTHYKELWVAFTSNKDPIGAPNETTLDRALIISNKQNELKIIGEMSVALSDSDLSPVGWEKSMYNPSILNIHNFGRFISSERYYEPSDDGFSLQDYLEDK